MISPVAVNTRLLPWLGTAFLTQHQPLCERASQLLFAFQPDRDMLATLAQQLDNLLFMAVREQTQGRMALQMDDGQLYRLRINDFALMADELLYLLFEAMEPTPTHQAIIREYSLRSGSLSALRALYLLYAGHQSPEENATIRRIIVSCHPPWRFRQWLED